MVSSVVFTDPQPGRKTSLTIDERIQYVAETRTAPRRRRKQRQTGSVVVMSPDTGEVLAIANAMKDHEPSTPTSR